MWPALPGAGVTPVLFGWLLGARQIVRPSSRGRYFAEHFHQTWHEAAGADGLSLVFGSPGSEWRRADAVIASGGDETLDPELRDFLGDPPHRGRPTMLGYGHRVSLAVIVDGPTPARGAGAGAGARYRALASARVLLGPGGDLLWGEGARRGAGRRARRGHRGARARARRHRARGGRGGPARPGPRGRRVSGAHLGRGHRVGAAVQLPGGRPTAIRCGVLHPSTRDPSASTPRALARHQRAGSGDLGVSRAGVEARATFGAHEQPRSGLAQAGAPGNNGRVSWGGQPTCSTLDAPAPTPTLSSAGERSPPRARTGGDRSRHVRFLGMLRMVGLGSSALRDGADLLTKTRQRFAAMSLYLGVLAGHGCIHCSLQEPDSRVRTLPERWCDGQPRSGSLSRIIYILNAGIARAGGTLLVSETQEQGMSVGFIA